MISRKDSNDTIYKRILFNYHSFQLANRKLVPRPRLKSSRYCFLGPSSCFSQPRPQGLLVFQYGGGKREDPGNDVVVFSSFSLTLMMIFFLRGNQLYFLMLSPKSSEVGVGPGAGVKIYLFNLILIHVFFLLHTI